MVLLLPLHLPLLGFSPPTFPLFYLPLIYFLFLLLFFFFFFTSLKMCNKSRLLRHGQVSELGTGLPSFSSASNVGLFVTRLNDQPRPRL